MVEKLNDALFCDERDIGEGDKGVCGCLSSTLMRSLLTASRWYGGEAGEKDPDMR